MFATAQKVLATIAIAGLLLLGFDYATYAANGQSLLLGHANKESKTTTVVNRGAGPAIRLKTRPGAPPLSVSSKKKVKRLNADTLDGVHAGALRKVRAGRFVDADTTTTWGGRTWEIPAPAPGAYLISFTTGIYTNNGSPTTPNATECLVQDSTSGLILADMTTYDGGFVPLLSGATVHPVTKESQLSIVCGTEAAGPNRLYFPLTVSLTRLDGETTTPLAPAPAPAPGPGARTVR